MSGVINVLLATTDEGGGGGGGGGAFTATASPNELTGFVVGSFGGTAVTGEPSAVSVVGGVPGYTYLWSRVSGDTSTYAEFPTRGYTNFAAYFDGGSESRTSVWKCTVTDAASNVVDTNTVSVFLTFEAIIITGPYY